eukprot:scaffold1923_cov86-Skeletonema_marinoi.AAC.1
MGGGTVQCLPIRLEPIYWTLHLMLQLRWHLCYLIRYQGYPLMHIDGLKSLKMAMDERLCVYHGYYLFLVYTDDTMKIFVNSVLIERLDKLTLPTEATKARRNNRD